jgi:nucleoside-diphosphate-sugar epimerase
MRVKDVYDIFHGGAIPEFAPIRSTFVDVRDVASLVLNAITNPTSGRYLLVGNPGSPISPQAMADVLRETYPERRDLIPEGKTGETYPEMTFTFDSNKARNLLGRDWIPFKKSVEDSAEAFLHLGSNPV